MKNATLHLAGMLSHRGEGYLRQIPSLIFANLRSSLAPAAITLVLSVLISVSLSTPANSQVTSPDLLAAKALLAPKQDAKLALNLSRSASMEAIDREDLAWLALMLCEKSAACDATPNERAFEKEFPTNGVVWLNALNRSAASGDDDHIDEALKKIAQAGAVRFHWDSILGHLARAMHAADGGDLPALLDSLDHALANVTFPDINPAIRACKGPTSIRPGRTELCRRAGIPLMETDTLFGDVIGVVIEKNSWSEGTPQRGLIDARVAWNKCRGTGRTELFDRASATNEAAESFVGLLLALPSEHDVDDALRAQNSHSAVAVMDCGPKPASPTIGQ